MRAVRAGTLPVVATALTGMVGLYIALVAFGNITDFGTNQEFVRHVFAMDTTFKDEDLMWRAVENRTVADVAYVGIIIWETAAALLLLWATVLWAGAVRRHGPYDRPRRASTLGLLMLMLLFGVGFWAIGGEWFAMWQSGKWNGTEAAARNFVFAAVTLILVHLPAARAAGDRTES